MDKHVLMAFGLTLFAGLSTGIGSALAFFARQTNKQFLAGALGFSAGVLIYVSFVELLPDAREILIAARGDTLGAWLTAAGFFGGILAMLAIDMLVPSYENPHEPHLLEEMEKPKASQVKLLRMGGFTAIAIAVHNFPEGIATLMAALTDMKLGISIAVAIAIHNIPEGISISIPVFYATGNRKKAFWMSFLSGLSEPVGAVVGYVFLRRFLGGHALGVIFASVAGIMVYVSLDEVLPAAREYGTNHATICGVIAGMAVMAASLLLLA